MKATDIEFINYLDIFLSPRSDFAYDYSLTTSPVYQSSTYENDLVYKNMAFFKFDKIKSSVMDKVKNTDTLASMTQYLQYAYYPFLVLSHQEQHTETPGMALLSISDTFVYQSTGSVPTSIRVTGFFHKSPLNDERLNFINLYNSVFRGVVTSTLDLPLIFGFKNVAYKVYITALNLIDSVEHDYITMCNLDMVAEKYYTHNIFAPKLKP